jgi:hypothetical protein
MELYISESAPTTLPLTPTNEENFQVLTATCRKTVVLWNFTLRSVAKLTAIDLMM